MTTPARRPNHKITPARRKKFLEALAEGETVTGAARRAGTHKRRFYEVREADPDFAAAWQEAIEAGTDKLEDELRRMAEAGWQEVDEEFDADGNLKRRLVRNRRDPRMLKWLREWRRPAVDVSVQVGAPLEVAGRPAVGWQDLFAVAEREGVAHLVFGQPERAEVVDAEAVELPDDEPANEDAVSPVPGAGQPPEPLTLAELADLIDASRDEHGRSIASDLTHGR